ncbi:MAG: hypothetical protein P4M11_04330 [Candidatus Pacebacteria bacterium]|nr:hypothetical protein [Candidatus Paceibacterota bacterium]
MSLQTNKGGYERIYTHKKMLGCTYIISYLVLMVLAEGYFVLQFVLRSQFYNKLNEFTTIYHKAYEDMVSLLQTVDVYREYYNNPSTTVGRIKLLRDSVFTEWESLYTAQKETENVIQNVTIRHRTSLPAAASWVAPPRTTSSI